MVNTNTWINNHKNLTDLPEILQTSYILYSLQFTMPTRRSCCLKKCFNTERSKGNFCARKSKEIASLMKMWSTLKTLLCITKGVLAIICSNPFSN